MIYKTLHRKLATRIPLKPGVNLGAPEGLAVYSAPHVTPVVLLLSDTNII